MGAASNHDLMAARRLYGERHPDKPLPSYRCFRELVGRLQAPFHRSDSGGRPNTFSVHDEEAILDFFDEDIGSIVLPNRLDGETYLQVLSEQVEDLLEELPLRVYRDLVFQQDGAPAHYSRAVRTYLDRRFRMWIGRGGTIAWPPRSPDLTPLDFFLWGYLKGVVYASECHTAEEMRRVVEASVVGRARLCCSEEGRHIEPYLGASV